MPIDADDATVNVREWMGRTGRGKRMGCKYVDGDMIVKRKMGEGEDG